MGRWFHQGVGSNFADVRQNNTVQSLLGRNRLPSAQLGWALEGLPRLAFTLDFQVACCNKLALSYQTCKNKHRSFSSLSTLKLVDPNTLRNHH